MAFCSKCGAALEEGQKFCPSCGAAIGGGAQTDGTQNAFNSAGQSGAANSQYIDPQQDIAANKGISVLCYFGILLLIPLLTQPNSPFVKFHSNQGLVLLLLWIALGVVAAIPLLGWIVSAVGYVFSLVCFIMGIVNACNGETKELPLIGSIKILN